MRTLKGTMTLTLGNAELYTEYSFSPAVPIRYNGMDPPDPPEPAELELTKLELASAPNTIDEVVETIKDYYEDNIRKQIKSLEKKLGGPYPGEWDLSKLTTSDISWFFNRLKALDYWEHLNEQAMEQLPDEP